ncbi:helix-turn-helix domain-containing protein [Actinoplanes sp. NPDC051411]|uniref:TetR/AcrR family transcriptional regulator n=1 Tax=Actinoplanes sp. NPDC051411 TaxID=3155522 RepID=UPI0034394EAC
MNSQSDLTARARIRDAAITLFAEKGIEAATIREIAQAAGVSSGLLRHHFGSKEGLRDACDEYAFNKVTSLGIQFTETNLLGRVTPEIMRLQQYAIQSVMDGSPNALATFDRALEYGEYWLEHSGIEVSDPRAYLAVIAVMKMSMFAMRDLLSHALGQSVDEPAGWARVISASIEIFSQPLVTPDLVEQARKALAEFTASTPEEQP